MVYLGEKQAIWLEWQTGRILNVLSRKTSAQYRLFSLNGFAHNYVLSPQNTGWHMQVFNKYLLNEWKNI